MKNAFLAFSRAAAVCALFPFSSLAGGPTGGVVVGGNANATIVGQGTSSTTINQAANLAIINWQQFSIGQGDTVKFVQPSATAVALNRILSGNPTEIYGTLQANGRVIVINPNGIMVGPGGTVDTKGFVASTLNVSDANFLSGGPMLFSGASTAAVRNQGIIQALGGDVFLIAHTVDNSGTINAPQGTVGLAAGSAVQLVPSGNERISVLAGNTASPAAVGVNNSGTIAAASAELKAAGGNIYALAINNGGVVRATGIVQQNGHIYLRANGGNIQNSGTLAAQNADGSGGTIVVDGGHNATAPATVISSGTIDASGSASGVSGGTVEILGDNVGLFDNALVDVSGDAGGGTALIGGGLHGANSAVQNAEHTYVGLGAVIKADATGQGNGGEIVIWSDGVTRDYGSLSAVGGAAGGNGGFAEVSSKGVLDFDGAANFMAPAGKGGTLLLDPINITISTAAAANTTGFTPGTDNTEAFADDNAVSSTFHINANGTSAGSSFAGVGDGATIVLQAQNNITVANAFNLANETGNNNVSLSLQAGNNINVNAAVTANGTGTLTLSANDNGGGTATGNGAVNFGASGSLVTAGQTVSISGQNITVGGLGINTTGSADNAGGNVNLNAGGTLALNAPIVAEGGVATAAGLAGGTLTLTGATITTSAGGSINTSGSDATTGLGGAGGNITFTSTGTLSAGNLTANGGAGVGSAGGNAGTIHLNAATGITLNNDLISIGGTGSSVGNGGPISLSTTAGGVSQTVGSLESGGLLLLGAGTYNITDSGNTVGTIAANVNGSVTYQDANALNIGNVLGQNGIVSSGKAINVSTVDSALSVGTDVDAGASTVTLTAGSSGDDNLLNIAPSVIVHGAGGITLTADNMTIGAAASINAGTSTATLRQFENGTLINLGGANGVSTLGLSAAALNTVTAGTLQIGNANSGALTVTGAIAPTSLLSLQSGATISQNAGATIIDGTLGLRSGGAINLPEANQVGVLSVTGAGGAVQFTDAQNLDLQGITAPAQTVTLTAGGVDTLGESAGVINASRLNLINWGATALGQVNQVGAFSVTGATGALQFTDAANLTVLGIADSGQAVTLTGSGGPTLGESGTITASQLNLNNWGATTLGQVNQVGALSVTGATGALQFTDAANLTVLGIADSGQAVTLTGSGSPTLGESPGIISASQLNLNNWGATTLNQANLAGILKVTGATGTFQYTTGANLDIQGIADPLQTVTLAGSGGHTVTESTGIINATELDLNNLGATTLNQVNQVGALGVSGPSGTVQFTDAANLTVLGITAPGQTVTLTGSGSPTLGQSGTITAGQLNLNTWGATTLNQPANDVDNFQVTGATGQLQFTDDQNLDVLGIGATGQTVTLTAGGIAVLTETAGTINASVLNLANWGAATLTQVNQVGALSVTGPPGPLQFKDAANLTVLGIADPGQPVTLTGSGSPTLVESGTITASQLNLNNWGATTLTQLNTVGVLTVAGATGALQFTDTQNLDLQGIGAAGQTVTLTGLGSPTLGESGGTITAGQLNLNNWAATTLGQPNQAAVLTAAGITGLFQYNTGSALDIRGLSDPAFAVTLIGAGNNTVTESTGVINTPQFNLQNLGTTTLNQANIVANLQVIGAGGALQFTDATGLSVQNVAATGQAVTIAVTGDDNELTVVGGDTVTGSSVTLAGDRINLAGIVTTPGVAWFHESTAGRQITVGTDDISAPTASGGTLGLTTAEINNVTAGTLRIGDANSGNLAVTVPFAPAFGTLSLQSGGTVSEAPGTMITINNLAVQAASGINLITANQVGTLAAISGGPIQFNNLGALAIGSADGVNGVTANNNTINITADSGGLTVNNTPAAADVNAGSGAVNLTAGTAGSLLTIAAGAGVSGSGGITFTADDMAISGPINSGTANTIFQPLTAGQVANLGSSFVAGDLNLSQAELNEVTANVLQIGNNTSGAPLGVGLVTAPLTVNQLLIIGGNSSITILSQQLAALSAVSIPAPKLDVAQFSSAALSLDEVSKILPAGAIGTIWLQLPFPKEKQRIYKVEEISKWTSGRVAAVGGTTGPQTPR